MKGVEKMANRKRPTLNPLTDIPRRKTELTKDFMLAYIKAKGTEEDKIWFKEKVKQYTVEKDNKLRGEKKIKGLEITALRDEFAERFFPNLIKSKDWFAEVENL